VPYKYNGHSNEPAKSLMGRAEIRASFAKLDSNGRRDALESDPRTVEAILEQPHFIFGLSKTEWDTLYAMERESKFANELAELDVFQNATLQVQEALRTVNAAVENELKAVGQPAIEPEAKQPSDGWA
jgi:hypothetical protein